jgi:hypothetical protein
MLSRSAKLNVMAHPPGAPSREAVDNKYRRSTVTRAPDASEMTATVYAGTSASLKKDDYHPPSKSHEIKMLPMEKPTEKVSVYRQTFPDFREEVCFYG